MLNIRKHQLLRNNSLFGKLLRLPFLIIPKNTVFTILSGPLKGKKWILGSHNKSVCLGTYEHMQTSTFVEKCKNKKILWDLGAHVGYYTLLFKEINKESKVYSFEPVERNTRFFLKHMELNRIKNVFLFNQAVSDKEGRLKFARGNHVGGKLNKSGDMEVQVVMLSRLLEENLIEPPQVIKMDIEGAELEVLEDIKGLLHSGTKPIIFLSTHGKKIHDACLEMMEKKNYNIIPLDGKIIAEAREFLLEPA